MLDFKIKDWERHFWLKESAKHAEVTWTKFPVSTESISYKRLMAFREGRDAYCVFVAIVQMVARKRLPGVLRDGNTTIDVADISLATGLSPKVVQASIERLALPTIGWLEPISDLSATVSPPVVDRFQNGDKTADNRFQNGGQPVNERRKTALEVEEEKEEDKGNTPRNAARCLPPASQGADAAAPPLPEKPKPPPVTWDHLTGWRGIDERRRTAWAAAYPACDLDRQLAAMHAWLTANPTKARKSNYERFITNWLAREQDRGGDMRSNGNGNGLRTNGRGNGSASHAAERRAAKAAREYPEPDIELPVVSFSGSAGADDPEWPPVPAPGSQNGRIGA